MERRRFLTLAALAAAGKLERPLHAAPAGLQDAPMHDRSRNHDSDSVTLFLCGDVMPGRGIDQILPQPSSPEIYEPYMSSALQYLAIAERASGRIPRRVDYGYVWGDALSVLDELRPQARIINLETAVTTRNDYWPGKGINYRMHPANTPCLTAARIDCCALANNHVLDWGYAGLQETLHTLHAAGIKTAGAGNNLAAAQAPAVIELDGDHRCLVFSLGLGSSGLGAAWAAGKRRPGVWRLPDLSRASVARVADQIHALRRAGDIVIASIHWGGNWGYEIAPDQRRFAHALIDEAAVDVLHGHSSHHPRGIEHYHDKLILYGCGDFLNDYEGIDGYENFRGDLVLMYLPRVDRATGRLQQLLMLPMQIRRFRLRHASQSDGRWLSRTLDRESRKLGSAVQLDDGVLKLKEIGKHF